MNCRIISIQFCFQCQGLADSREPPWRLGLWLVGKDYDLGFGSLFIFKSHWQVCLSIRYVRRRYLQAMVLLNPELVYLLVA